MARPYLLRCQRDQGPTPIPERVNFLDLHTGVDKVGDFVLERELQDLAAYYEDENFRGTARQR